MSDTPKLIDQLSEASRAIYAQCPKEVAVDISGLFAESAERIRDLERENADLRERLEALEPVASELRRIRDVIDAADVDALGVGATTGSQGEPQIYPVTGEVIHTLTKIIHALDPPDTEEA